MAAILIGLLFTVIINLYSGVAADAPWTTADYIYNFGYSNETHALLTEDGYFLKIFRIKATTTSGNERASRPVVLLMHGLVSSSDCWVLNGPSDALAFNLADAGYDVWLGNARGNTYSNGHESMSPSESRFWRFSWHEIGALDLPATIDYILQETGQSSLHYVGHSQGTTSFFVLLSTQPEYNLKLRTSHMLAPIAYTEHASFKLLSIMALIYNANSLLNSKIGDTAFMQQKFIRSMTDECAKSVKNVDRCATLLYAVSGGYSAHLNLTLLPDIFSTHPASCSTHQALHYVQLRKSGRFCQYDFGRDGNAIRYNAPSPPDYDVSNIQPPFPVQFYYSAYDEFASITDVEKLCDLLGQNCEKNFIQLENFAHIDFLWSYHVKEDINQLVLATMKEAEDSFGQARVQDLALGGVLNTLRKIFTKFQ